MPDVRVTQPVLKQQGGPTVGINGLGMQALELEVLEMSLIVLLEISFGAGWVHAGVSSRNVAESPH